MTIIECIHAHTQSHRHIHTGTHRHILTDMHMHTDVTSNETQQTNCKSVSSSYKSLEMTPELLAFCLFNMISESSVHERIIFFYLKRWTYGSCNLQQLSLFCDIKQNYDVTCRFNPKYFQQASSFSSTMAYTSFICFVTEPAG